VKKTPTTAARKPPTTGVRRRKAAPVPEPETGPRYAQIARELTAAIASGQYPVGAHLPTELELCEQFSISRFTAREAVRVLSAAGLITRRQRVGTVVIATPADARYTHALSSVGDLHQYAQDTELRLVYIGKLALPKAKAEAFSAQPGEEWVYAVGMRHGTMLSAAEGDKAGVRPICITRLYLCPALKGIEAKLRERKTAACGTGTVQRGAGRRRRGQSGRGRRFFGVAHRAALFRRKRAPGGSGRKHPPRRPFHLPHGTAQIARGQTAGAAWRAGARAALH